MKTSRINKLVGTVALCWLITASVAFGQATITHIPHLGSSVMVAGLNNAGEVAGTSNFSPEEQHAILFSNGVLHDLGTLGGSGSVGMALNDLGVVVGYSVDATGTFHAFAYRNGAMEDLG